MSRRILTMDQTISELTRGCQQCFEALHKALAVNEDSNSKNELPKIAIEELTRFIVWANNIGAANYGTVSLDHRLRNADYLCASVKELLRDLLKTLSDGFNAAWTVIC
jgi:hypothetical protein